MNVRIKNIKYFVKKKINTTNRFESMLKSTWLILKRIKHFFKKFKKVANAPLRHYDIVVQVDNFLAGGLENVTLNLNQRLIDEGYTVILLVLGHTGKAVSLARKMKIPVHVMPYSEKAYQIFIKEVNPKLILAHYSWKGFRSISAMNIPIIQVVHNVYIWFNEQERQEFQASANFTDIFVCVSDYSKDYTVSRLGISQGKCLTIPNGVDINKFKREIPTKKLSKLLKKLKLKGTDFVFLNVGAINHQKNQISLLRAFQKIAARCPNAKLVLLGPIYEYCLYEELNDYIQKHKLKGRVIYAGSSDTPEEYYKIADAFVHSANFEGGQLSLIEYLIGNKPIISTNIGFCRHVSGLKGIEIVSPHIDINSFSGKIWEIKSSKQTINELAEAMIRVYNNATLPQIPEEIIDLMDYKHSYNLYLQLAKTLINNESPSIDSYRNVWTTKIQDFRQGKY